ncbi:MAG: tellurite resistance TerB family protein, partial [Rhodospirillales bacterium]|nr:tellurite resistance TerB family protein [Rhodospirillales bacterium]
CSDCSMDCRGLNRSCSRNQIKSPYLNELGAFLLSGVYRAKNSRAIDAEERSRIEDKITELQLGREEQSFLLEQLRKDSDPIEIARLSGSDEQSAEIYLVSAIAIDADTIEEKRYLDRLSDALRMPSDLRARIDQAAMPG